MAVGNASQPNSWASSHQTNTWITERLSDITNFYLTTDSGAARQFLKKYNVKYIIVGQLEQVTYSGIGLEKFPAFNGVLWNQVYQDANTTIYQVIR